MTPKETTRDSKFLSLVLRHQPDAAGITLDSAGWTEVDVLLAGCARAGRPLTREQLDHIVATNEKKRFEFSADGTRIRASQGHSVDVELDYSPQTPPELLYHGTATRFLDAIRADGLRKRARHHVHLSAETAVTLQVGARYGKPALLVIHAGDMHRAGWTFFRSTNGVWLVDAVPAEFIEFPDSANRAPQPQWGEATKPRASEERAQPWVAFDNAQSAESARQSPAPDIGRNPNT